MGNIITEEGYYLSDEDSIFYIRWKVKDLHLEGYTDEYILKFDEDPLWYHYAKIELNILKKTDKKHGTKL